MMNRRNVFRLLLCTAMAAAVFVASALFARADAIDATCRVTVERGVGSGCVFQIDNGYAYVVTAAHVVAGKQAATCEFWRSGHQSSPLPATILAASEPADVAILAIPTAAFGGVLPDAVPLAKNGFTAKPGATIESVGCARGAWPSAWRGHVIGYDQVGLHFVPPPMEGRSGAAILDENGKQIIGVIRARAMDDKDGLAVPITAVHRLLATRGQMGSINRENGWQADGEYLTTQCPGQCPPMVDDEASMRTRRQQRQPTPATPWPTLPAEQVQPIPSVDLSPIEQQLADIRSAMAAPTQVASVDPAAQQALGLANQANQGVQQLRQDVPAIVASQIKPIGDKVDQIGGAVAPLVKLQAQLQADAEAGGVKGRIAGKILDAGEDPMAAIHKEMGIVGAVVAIGLLIVFGVFHLIRTGKGPAHEIIEKLAAKHPDSERLAILDAKLGTIDAKILAAVQPIQQQLNQVALATPPVVVPPATTTTPTAPTA